jgi:DNA-binding HxlR family transcriptional regulator
MSEKLCYVGNKEPFEYTLSIVSGKWKLKIIYLLACMGTIRYGVLKRNIDGITHKMLSS